MCVVSLGRCMYQNSSHANWFFVSAPWGVLCSLGLGQFRLIQCAVQAVRRSVLFLLANCSHQFSMSANAFHLRFHGCVVNEIKRSFKAYIGNPPHHCSVFRRYAVAMSVRRDDKMLSSMLSMSVLPNGDWNCHSETQCYVPAGVPFDEAELADTFSVRVADVLVPGVFKLMSKDIVITFQMVMSALQQSLEICLASKEHIHLCSRSSHLA